MSVKPQFNELIHSPVRLRICALLRPVGELEFSVIARTLELSDAHLSKNLRSLAEAGIIELRKAKAADGIDARRKSTWVKLTGSGQNAVEGHLAALAELAAGVLPEERA